MSTKTLLEEEIQSEIDEISKLDVGSEKHKAASEALAKLLDKYNELEKTEIEAQDKYDDREAEREHREAELAFKEKQLKHEKRDAIIKNILTGVTFVGGCALTIWGTKVSIKFEETGSFTTIMGRGFVQKLLPSIQWIY